jgi:rhodanese-related sulfurtransferase
MGRRAAKDALFDAFASVAKALGNGHRAEIVDVLAQGERSVEEVAGEIGQSVANTSHHLHVLAGTGLLRSRRDGQRILYSLTSDRVGDLWAALRDVAAAHVANVEVLAEEYLGDREDIETVTAEELTERLARGRAVVLDVRPTVEFDAGHIAGARSTPLGDLPSVLADLPKSRDIVAYCRGPYCVYADDAVRLLRAKGYRARRLDGGYPEWQRTGRAVESATTVTSPTGR